MKKTWPLVALGIVAFLAFAIFTLPARVVLGQLERFGIHAGGVQGTIWNGSAQVLQIGDTHVGSVNWKLHILPLLTLRPAATVDVKRTDGFARSDVTLTGNRVVLENVSASLPISALPPQVAPGGWQGSINARFATLTLADGWPVAADGTLDLMDLTGPPRRPANLGSFRVTFPANDAADSDTLTGTLSDIDGPIQITGTLQLKASDRSYLIDGLLATKPGAPADFQRSLEFLGPPDAQGRRQFSLSGTL